MDMADSKQTWKMPEMLPEQDFSFPSFTRKWVNCGNLVIANKKGNLTAITMYTIFTS